MDVSFYSAGLEAAIGLPSPLEGALVLEPGEDGVMEIRAATPDEIALLSQRRIERMARFPIPIVEKRG